MSELKFWDFASAWYSRRKEGNISVSISDKSEVDIYAVHKTSGEKIKLTSFFLSRNESKDKPDANPNWPDYRVAFTTGNEE